MRQRKTLKNIQTYYWTNDRNSAGIDFLLDTGGTVIPLEVKAEVSLQAKSLWVFREKFNPKMSVRSKSRLWVDNFNRPLA